MPRIPPLEREETTGEARATFDRELARFGRLTNRKRSLLQSPTAYRALMEWYLASDKARFVTGSQFVTDAGLLTR